MALLRKYELYFEKNIMYLKILLKITCITTDPIYSELKSPISLVHENALKRNMMVKFEVARETGPPHMRTFLTR